MWMMRILESCSAELWYRAFRKEMAKNERYGIFIDAHEDLWLQLEFEEKYQPESERRVNLLEDGSAHGDSDKDTSRMLNPCMACAACLRRVGIAGTRIPPSVACAARLVIQHREAGVRRGGTQRSTSLWQQAAWIKIKRKEIILLETVLSSPARA